MAVTTRCFLIFFLLFFFFFFSWCLSSSFATVQYFNFTQTLDHFGLGGQYNEFTFQQRYMVDDEFWAGAQKRGLILVYFGGESLIDFYIDHVAVIMEGAPLLQALIVYIEHRFYGFSVPFGSIDIALANVEVRRCLTSEQALADFAKIITSLKMNLSATNSPVIVLGASYGGILAAWFRLKYPHIATGAVASSAPILFFEEVPQEMEFCSIVSKDFEHISKKCSDVIRQSWSMIDEIASRDDGLSILSKTFNLCSALKSSHDLKVLLVNMYSFAAQYNGRYSYWINLVCNAILETQHYNIVEGVAHALNVVNNKSCVSLNFTGFASPVGLLDANSLKAWDWQLCSELIAAKGCNDSNSMLPQEAFSSKTQYMENCRQKYHTLPRADWISIYYGGQDIKAGSNIIFSNGLMDPYSGVGILNDISDTIVAVTTKEGSHCLDFNAPLSDDPKWLVNQRKKEIIIIEHWIQSGASNSFLRRFVSFTNVFTYLLVLLYFVL